MIITGTKTEVLTSPFLSTEKAKLKASAHGMRLLSSQLYTRPIRAIVREICTNALDANVVNRATKPFVVLMPTAKDPTFYVKDFGPGISDHRMMNEFLTFFETDKGQTNDQIGGFGLGSKAPYSHSDHFTIVSKYDGMRRTYLAFTNELDEFAIGKVSEEPCDSETGLEVCVPVRTEDFDDFRAACEHYLPHFPASSVRVYGAAIDPIQYELELPSCKLRKGNGSSYIKVGPIPYDVEWGALSGKIDPTELELLWKHPFEFQIPVGAVHIHPSREKLNQTDLTINVLKELALAALSALRTHKQEIVDQCKTVWEARIQANHLNDVFDTGYSKEFIYRGNTYDLHIDLKNCNVVPRQALGERSPVIRLEDEGYVVPNQRTRVVIHDLLQEKPHKVRVKRRLITAFGQHPGVWTFILLKDIAQLGDIPTDLITRLSDYPVPRPTPKNRVEKVPLRVYRYSRGTWRLDRLTTNSHDIKALENDPTVCWVPMKLKLCAEERFRDLQQLPSFKDIKIYGFSGAVLRAADVKNIPTLRQLHERRVQTLIADTDLIDAALMRFEAADISDFRSQNKNHVYPATCANEDNVNKVAKRAWGKLGKELYPLFFDVLSQSAPHADYSSIVDVFHLYNNNLLPENISSRFTAIESPTVRYEKILANAPILCVMNKLSDIKHLDIDDKITLIKSIVEKT